MALVVGTNSYLSRADAEDIAAGKFGPRVDAWLALIEDNRDATLMQATADIDGEIWLGDKTSESQALAFPRDGDADIPEYVKAACVEQAMHLALTAASAERREELSRAGARSASIGGITESYAGGQAPRLCARALSLLDRYVVRGARIV